VICREVKKWSEKIDEEEKHVAGGCATEGIVKCLQFCHVRGGDGEQGRTRGFDLRREGPVIVHAHVALESTAVAGCGERQRPRALRSGRKAGKVEKKRVSGEPEVVGGWAKGDAKVGREKRSGGKRVGTECGDRGGGQGRQSGHR
jgi:hypothetical protein